MKVKREKNISNRYISTYFVYKKQKLFTYFRSSTEVYEVVITENCSQSAETPTALSHLTVKPPTSKWRLSI
jgi:hypothetical protein